MSQAGYTPILIYSSSTTTNAPAVGNLTNSTLGSELAINITDGKLFYKDNANAIQVIGWKVRPASAGGTGLTSFAVGDLLYADTTTTLAKLADVATGNALISGGVGVAPSWGKIGLTTHVSGVLPTANGGTNLSSFTANGVMYASSTSALATGTALTFDGNQLSVLRASTTTALFDDAEIRAINTGTATINQRVDIAMRWQDGTYNGTGGIGMVRESATARSGTLTFYPINSSGDALAAMRLSSAGDATVTTGNVVIGTSGKGIDFSATAGTGTSELLADYEEGTWTPTLVCGTSGTITLNSGFAGTYTKVGRQVTVCVTVYVDSVSVPVGSLRLNGLPYTCNSGNSFGSGAAIHGQTTLVPAGSSLDARVIAGEAAISIYAFTAGTVVNAASYVQATTLFTITCSYFV